MKRRIVLFASFLVIFSILATFAIGSEYWACKNTGKYHLPDCHWAQEISPEDLIRFKSPEDAIKAGYQPCNLCKPPTISR